MITKIKSSENNNSSIYESMANMNISDISIRDRHNKTVLFDARS